MQVCIIVVLVLQNFILKVIDSGLEAEDADHRSSENSVKDMEQDGAVITRLVPYWQITLANRFVSKFKYRQIVNV